MSEIITEYGSTVSFLASIFGILGGIVGVILYVQNKSTQLSNNKHRLIVEKRSFEKSMLKGLKDLGLHDSEESISIHELKTLYVDPKRTEKLKLEASGSYDQVFKIISINQDIENSKLQLNILRGLLLIIALLIIFILYPCA